MAKTDQGRGTARVSLHRFGRCAGLSVLNASGLVGLSPVDVRAEVARAIAAARALCDDLRDARDAAASARRNRPGGLNPDRAAWFDGYAEGPL